MSSGQITREILGNVSPWVAGLFYVATFIACAWTALSFYRRARAHRSARAPRTETAKEARHILWSSIVYLTFHRQLLRDRYAGIAHLLTFYGFFILFIGTCLVFLEYDTPLHFFYGWFYRIASLVIDLGGVAFMIGLGMFLWRRHFAREGKGARLLRVWWVAALAWLLAAIGISGFLLEGARIARDFPAFERWSIAGYGIAVLLETVGLQNAAAEIHRWCWILHALLCVAFFALLPWKFFGHIIYGLISWVTRRRDPVARLQPQLDSSIPFVGAQAARDLSPRDLMQADACTTCGRCNDVCPAHAAGKPLRPREVVLGVRTALNAGIDEPLKHFVADEALWSCTTCGACNAACPVGIDIYGKIVSLRRGRIEAGDVPHAAEDLFESVADRFNPFQRPNQQRMVWAQGLNVPVATADEPIELLYWIGCAGSFDPDGQSIARSMIKVLNHLGVNYRLLGTGERCSGDPARRLGEEGLFQELVDFNRAQFARHNVHLILTHCPHCYNTFRNEYQSADATNGAATSRIEVLHHSEFLRDRLATGQLRTSAIDMRNVTFHDPCYLGRGNNILDAPRELLASIGTELVEMPRSGMNSFCCGAGGGSMWLDVQGSDRVENIRFREAAETGATTIVTGCPFCKTMLETARQAQQSDSQRVRVRDLAEVIVDATRI